MTLELQAPLRDSKDKASELRDSGKIPAVIYSAGKDTISVSLDEADFVKVFREAGEATVIAIKTGSGEEQALIQDVQLDPVSGKVLHVDFKAVVAGEAITVTVPLVFEGESPAVKSNLGLLTKVLHEIEIEVLPKDLPSELVVDLTKLATMEDQILVKDINLPSGVTLVTGEDEVVAVIATAKEESEEEVSADIDFSQIEVEKKGKAEEAPAEGE